nr:Sak-like ssDNA annealing protein [Caudoviricetes sp.]CAI9751078.1 Sak-like ssDNA annealing protein [Caudoviricetes sp.]
MSVFQTLSAIDVSGKTEKKSNLTYLSWAWAWGELKKLYPDASYNIYENEIDDLLIHGEQAFPIKRAVNYFTDGRTAWVKVGVTVDGQEHIEMLPVMDHRNKSIALNSIDSFAVNKTIQRALTKAIARHGLGLYIYAGEDLPETVKEEKQSEQVLAALQSALNVYQKANGVNLTQTFDDLSELTKGAVKDVQTFQAVNDNQKAYIINYLKKTKKGNA